jgi:hypothetical protein
VALPDTGVAAVVNRGRPAQSRKHPPAPGMLRKVIQSVAGGAYLRTVFVGLYATQGGKNVRVPRLKQAESAQFKLWRLHCPYRSLLVKYTSWRGP